MIVGPKQMSDPRLKCLSDYEQNISFLQITISCGFKYFALLKGGTPQNSKIFTYFRSHILNSTNIGRKRGKAPSPSNSATDNVEDENRIHGFTFQSSK
jgi:hypothetical protein